MVKKRPKISQDTVDRLLVSCKHSCCICEKFGVEIHHIDGNPSNNQEDNLIPLCGSCAKWVHVKFSSEARIHGYSPEQLKIYKLNWIKKCKNALSVVAELKDLKETLSDIKGSIKKLQERKK